MCGWSNPAAASCRRRPAYSAADESTGSVTGTKAIGSRPASGIPPRSPVRRFWDLMVSRPLSLSRRFLGRW